MSADWFAGEARSAAHRTFLTRLREPATRDGLRDVPSSTTSAVPVGDVLVVLVPLPRLTARSKPALQVGLDSRDPGAHDGGGFPPWRTADVVERLR